MGARGNSIQEIFMDIDPYDFESLIAEIWKNQGWKARATSGSQDRGIDVIARQKEPIPLTVAVQAKAYSQDNKIGSDQVRKYRTLYDQEEGVNAVAIATTGRFTDQAEKLAEDLEINLLDLDDVIRMAATIDVMTFSSIVSPVNFDGYNLVDIPYPSSKGGCPECKTAGTLWEAGIENNKQVMMCEYCGEQWEAGANGKWVLID